MSRFWKWVDAFWALVYRDAETTATFAVERRVGAQKRMRAGRRP